MKNIKRLAASFLLAILSTSTVFAANYDPTPIGFGTNPTTTVTTGNPLPITVISGGGGAVTQSGTWTVQPGNTANTTAWKVDGSAVTQPVISTTTEVHLGEVGGNSAIITATLTRPANTTAYVSGQLLANSVTAGSVVPITLAVSRKTDGTVVIPRIRLKKTTTSITNAQFRVHFYKTSPIVTNGDGGAWLSTESNYIGYMDVTMDRVFSDGAKGFGTPAVGSQFIVEPSTGTVNIFALIELRAAYTPGSAEVFTVAAECLRD
jgi:hypothetical protein